MNKIHLIIAAGALFASPVLQAESTVEPPVAQKKQFKSANAVALSIVAEMRGVFQALSDVSSIESAKTFDAKVTTAVPAIEGLVVELKKQNKPNDTDIEVMAREVFKMTQEMEGFMKGMMALMMNPENKEIATSIQASMSKLSKVEGIEKVMQEYYPDEKMNPLLEALEREAKAKE